MPSIIVLALRLHRVIIVLGRSLAAAAESWGLDLDKVDVAKRLLEGQYVSDNVLNGETSLKKESAKGTHLPLDLILLSFLSRFRTFAQ